MKLSSAKGFLVIAAAALALAFTSCKKEAAPTPSTTATGTLFFHIHNNIDTNEVMNYGTHYSAADGRKISLSLGQFYISQVQLVKLDGSVYTVPDKIFLKTQEAEVYLVAKVPAGNYKSVRFKVGIDSTTNQLSPSSYSDPSVLNHSEMWFGSTAQPGGYIFLNAQGEIDTSASKSGKMAPFTYKIGTNANYVQVNMPDKNFSVQKDQAEYVHLMADYSMLFNGLTLTDPGNLSVKSASDNATYAAEKIVKNIPSMFSYED